MKLSLSLAALSLLAASPALAGGYGYGGDMATKVTDMAGMAALPSSSQSA